MILQWLNYVHVMHLLWLTFRVLSLSRNSEITECNIKVIKLFVLNSTEHEISIAH